MPHHTQGKECKNPGHDGFKNIPCPDCASKGWEKELMTTLKDCRFEFKYDREIDYLKSFIRSVESRAREEERGRVVEFIKGKSERVTKNLWYVSDACLEDVPRFFAPRSN